MSRRAAAAAKGGKDPAIGGYVQRDRRRRRAAVVRKELTPAARRGIGLGFLAAIVLLWHLLSVWVDKSYLLPGPLLVLQRIRENAAELFGVHLTATMTVVAIGGALSVLIGFLLAMVMDRSPRVEKALYPVLTATQTIPVMCIAPVFVLWFGYTVTMRVIVVVLVNFFTVAVNVFDGLKSTDEGRMELMTTWGASGTQKFFLLRLPNALPNFLTALEITIPWSMVAAAVSEWLGAPAGLGCYSRSCMMSLDAAGLLAPLVILTAAALLLSGVLKIIERKCIRWKGEN